MSDHPPGPSGAIPPEDHTPTDYERALLDQLAASEDFLDRIGKVAGVGGWKLDLATSVLSWTAQTCRIHDQPPDHRPTLDEAIHYYAPEVQAVLEAAVLRGIEQGEGWDLELPLVTAKGRHIWVRAQGVVERVDDRPACLVGAFQDITERRRDLDALLASERRFRNLFMYSPGLICTHDLEGRLLTVNPAACQSLGLSDHELVGRPIADLMAEEDARFFSRYLARITTRGSDAGRFRLVGHDGTPRVWQYHNVIDSIDGVRQVLGHAQDITEQAMQERRLREWSVSDALTGCYNRRFLAEFVDSEAGKGRWTCLAIDLDQFKAINDTFGHQRGDAVLVGMAAFFRTQARSQDHLIRLGGDEFLIIQPEGQLDDALALAERFNRASGDAPCAFTVGLAAHEEGQSLEAVLADADAALYSTRRSRRGAGDAMVVNPGDTIEESTI